MVDSQNTNATSEVGDLTDSLAQCLESMAFISVMPAKPPFTPPAELLQVELAFSGRASGIIELVASPVLGACFAANVLGISATDPTAAKYATDALKELLNALTGSLLRDWHGSGKFDLTLPTARAIGVPEWEAFISSAGTSLLDAEGNLIAVRVVN